MDEAVVREKGVVRMTARQLSMLWLETSDKCGVADIIDIHQPDDFTDEVSYSVYESRPDGAEIND